MKFIYLFLAFITVLFFQNCGTKFDVQTSRPAPITSTDPVFTPYIEEFEYYYGSFVDTVPIGFADLDPNLAGVCYKSTVGGKILRAYIAIDKEYWSKISEYQKINLIFHELGHCVLNRDHVPSNSVNLCPSSFMFEQIMTTTCIQNHFDEYIKEMFP